MHQRSQWPIPPATIPCTYICAAYGLQEEQEALAHFSASLATVARQNPSEMRRQPANILVSCPSPGMALRKSRTSIYLRGCPQSALGLGSKAVCGVPVARERLGAAAEAPAQALGGHLQPLCEPCMM